MKIRLVTVKDGAVVIERVIRQGLSLKEVCAIAERQVMNGSADYAKVTVNNEVYMQLEA